MESNEIPDLLTGLLQTSAIHWMAAGVALVLALFVILRLTRMRSRPPSAGPPTLLQPAEQEFLALLEQALADEYRVFPRIPLAIIVNNQQQTRLARKRALVAAADRCADFVVCKRESLAVVAIVAFGDPADQPLRQLCRKSGLALVPFNPAETHSAASARTRLLSAIDAPSEPAIGNLDGGEAMPNLRPEPELPAWSLSAAAAHQCPTCGAATLASSRGWQCPDCTRKNR